MLVYGETNGGAGVMVSRSERVKWKKLRQTKKFMSNVNSRFMTYGRTPLMSS